MAALLASAVTAEVALSAATAKTVLQITAPANHRVKVLGWAVAFDGVSTTEAPVVVTINRQSTAGTMTSLTPRPLDDSLSETIQATAQHTATVEPTTGNQVDGMNVHPQGGYQVMFPLGQEIIVGGGNRLGLICTAPAAVNVIAKFFFEE